MSTRQDFINAALADAPQLSDDKRDKITTMFAAHALAGDRK